MTTEKVRVGCWSTIWKQPEEIAAAQRTHDKYCHRPECRGHQSRDPESPFTVRFRPKTEEV